MKLYNSKNHLTKDGKAFEARIGREPVARLCFRYLKRGASIADMQRIVYSNLSYQLAMANLKLHQPKEAKSR